MICFCDSISKSGTRQVNSRKNGYVSILNKILNGVVNGQKIQKVSKIKKNEWDEFSFNYVEKVKAPNSIQI